MEKILETTSSLLFVFRNKTTGEYVDEDGNLTDEIYEAVGYPKLEDAIKALEDFEKILKCCKNHDPDSFEARRLRKEIYLQKRKIDEINSAIKDE